MNLTTTSMDLENDQARIRNIKMNEFIVQGDKFPYISIKLITSIILMAIVFSFSFFDLLLMEGLLHYISPFGPS